MMQRSRIAPLSRMSTDTLEDRTKKASGHTVRDGSAAPPPQHIANVTKVGTTGIAGVGCQVHITVDPVVPESSASYGVAVAKEAVARALETLPLNLADCSLTDDDVKEAISNAIGANITLLHEKGNLPPQTLRAQVYGGVLARLRNLRDVVRSCRLAIAQDLQLPGEHAVPEETAQRVFRVSTLRSLLLSVLQGILPPSSEDLQRDVHEALQSGAAR
jgi:hypothetical protein